jgi:exodeoxyribonuclease V alpha subunit
MLMTRNLLYTAVTRAKKMVILAGRLDMIRGMVENDRQVLRYTSLPTYLERNRRE